MIWKNPIFTRLGPTYKIDPMNRVKTLFLVEDDIDDQLFFSEAISELENAMLLDIANNGKEALNRLEKSVILPDLIFMDINMPEMNGIQCLEEIRKKPELKKIPVIILSGSSAEVALAHNLGANAYIEKPSSVTTLRAKLKQAISFDFIVNSAAYKIYQNSFLAI